MEAFLLLHINSFKNALSCGHTFVQATWGNFYEMEWDVAISWQLLGLRGDYMIYLAVTAWMPTLQKVCRIFRAGKKKYFGWKNSIFTHCALCTVLFYWFLLCFYALFLLYFQYFDILGIKNSCFLWNSVFFCFLPKFHEFVSFSISRKTGNFIYKSQFWTLKKKIVPPSRCHKDSVTAMHTL